MAEDLKAESSSNWSSSYPEPPPATHKTGLSLALSFSESLACWGCDSRSSKPASVHPVPFPHSAGMCEGEEAPSAGLGETSALCRASADALEWWKAFWVHLNGVSSESSFFSPFGLAQCHSRHILQDVTIHNFTGVLLCWCFCQWPNRLCFRAIFSWGNSLSCFYLLVIKDYHR